MPELAATKYQVVSLLERAFSGFLKIMMAETRATIPRKMLLRIVKEAMWCQYSILTPPKVPSESWEMPAVVPPSRRVARLPKIKVEITAITIMAKIARLIQTKTWRFLFIL